MWHNVLAKLRHMGAIIECEGEVRRRKWQLPVALASFKHFGNLRRRSVKEVYMINVRYR